MVPAAGMMVGMWVAMSRPVEKRIVSRDSDVIRPGPTRSIADRLCTASGQNDDHRQHKAGAGRSPSEYPTPHRDSQEIVT
jgi:hypothetical protein